MLNRCVIAGRLGYKRRTAKSFTGSDIINFQIECQREGKSVKADTIRCTAIGTIATVIIDNYRPGDLMTVSGRLQQKHFIDGEGNERVNYELLAMKAAKGETHEL